jgi:fumarate reductase subunit D
MGRRVRVRGLVAAARLRGVEVTRRSVEPLPWLLFSAGGVAAAMFLPVLMFIFAVAVPLGLVSAPGYDHLHDVLASPVTILVAFGVLTLSLFHWAHRFRFTLYDGLQIKHLNELVALLCYGGAVVGSVVTAYVLLQLL